MTSAWMVGRRWIAGIFWLLLAGCGGGSGGAPVPIEQLGPRLSEVLCENSAKCGGYPDVASCLGASQFSTAQLEADIASGKLKYDAAAAGTCLAAAASSAGCKQSERTVAPAACGLAIKGTVAEGGVCSSNDQCLTQVCLRPACDGTVACCAGSCGPARPADVAEGGSCAGASVSCAEGTFCRIGVAGSICTKLSPMGAACEGSTECVLGLACVREAGATTGTCGPYPKTGEACGPGSDLCDDAHDFCDPVSARCLKRLLPDADCSSAVGGCVPYARCNLTTGKCVALKAAGAACATLDECLGSLDCVGGVCVLPAADPVCP